MISYKNYEEDYQREKKHLEHLKRKQVQYQYGIPIGLVIIAIGYSLLDFVLKVNLSFFANLLYGPVLIGYGLWLVWRGFINQDWKYSLQLADRLHLAGTIPKQMEDCAARIGKYKRMAERSEKQLRDVERDLLGVEQPEPAQDEEMDWLLAGGKMPEKWDGSEKEKQ